MMAKNTYSVSTTEKMPMVCLSPLAYLCRYKTVKVREKAIIKKLI